MNPLVATQRRAYVRQCQRLGLKPCANGGWQNDARMVAGAVSRERAAMEAVAASKRKPTRAEREAEALRAWWLERFSPAEIHAMAGALWGEQ